MKLSEITTILKTVDTVDFELPNGTFVPENFHVTEIGQINKTFIDCGGTIRKETKVNFQLWNADDFEHRLKPKKLLHIIELSQKTLNIEDYEIEVEFQDTTIGRYDLDYNGKNFVLMNKQTACLAKDQCGISTEKEKLKFVNFSQQSNSCTPDGSCC